MDEEARELGPVDYALVEFPGSRFNGEIAPEIIDLVEKGLITVLDLVFITKGEDGSVAGMEITEMDADEIGSIAMFVGETNDLLSQEDIDAAGEIIEPGSSALFMIWENTWAAPLATAIYDSGGLLVDSGRIPAQDLLAAVEAAG